MDTLVVLGGALALGSPLALAPWPTALFAGLIAWQLWQRGQRRLMLVALGLLLINNARARAALLEHEAERRTLMRWLQSPRECHGHGVITAQPSALSEGALSVSITPTQLRCAASSFHRREGEAEELDLVQASGRSPQLRLVLPPWLQEQPLARGDPVRFEASLAVTQRFLLADLPDPRPRATALGVQLSGQARFLEPGGSQADSHPLDVLTRAIDAARSAVRARIRRYYSDEARPLAEALVLGDRSLSTEDQDAFAVSGLAHLLAVSGMHLVLAVASLQRAMRALLTRTALAARLDVRRPVALLAAVLALLYADFAGGSGSAWRAALSMALTLLAATFDRPLSTERALGGGVVVMAGLDPFVAHDLSFGLSVAATVGLCVLGGRLTAALTGWRLPAVLAKLLGPTLAASLFCAPLLARIGPELPSLAMLLNLIAIPLSEAIALPWCLLFAVLPPFDPLLLGCARAAGGALQLTAKLAWFGSELPKLPVPMPTPAQLALIAVGFVQLARLSRAPLWPWRTTLMTMLPLACALLGTELTHRAQAQPRGRLRITQLDIGQGDSALLDLPDGRAMLIDSGGIVAGADVGRRVLSPLLRARRRDRLAVVVVTHPHPDHFGGLATGAAEVQIEELWDTLAAEPPEETRPPREGDPVAPMRAAWLDWRQRRLEAGARALGPRELCGTRELGGATITVLSPCPALDPDLGANDNSIVLRIDHDGHRALFVGDAEHETEQRLIAADPAALVAEVLKVGHHGSRTSTSQAWLGAVRPQLALISAGARNRFGHPHPSTLANLRTIAVARTDRMGAVIMEWRAGRLLLERADFADAEADADIGGEPDFDADSIQAEH